MTPHRFRWARLYRMLYEDPTALLELLVTLFYTLLQGIFLAVSQATIPTPVVSWIAWGGFTPARFGWSLIGLAVLQIWASGTAWYRVRGWIAFAMALNALTVALAYWFANIDDRYVFPFLLGTIAIEGYLAARNWADNAEQTRTGATTRAILTEARRDGDSA